MSDEALRTLEQLRENAVDEAKRALADAQRQLTRAKELTREAASRRGVTCDELDRARRAGEGLRSVLDYQRAEHNQRALRVAQSKAEARLQKAQAMQSVALADVNGAEDRLRAAELERRAASHVIRERDAQRAHKAELRAEEDAADSHRARRT